MKMKALSFEGSGFEYFKIWIVNILLTIVTLGLYYPWAKVRNHRYFYGNSTLEGRNFEYHATGKQLFLGYLIAMTLFIAYVVIQQISVIGSMVVLFIFFFALPWIIWRSLKFNMRMSSYSNVRFGFAGNVGGAYINFMLFPILLFLTFFGPIMLLVLSPVIGMKFPDMPWLATLLPFTALALFIFAFYMYALIKKKSATYTLNGSRYGQGEFHTELETKAFAFIFLKTIGLSLLIFGSIFLVIAGTARAIVGLDGLKEMFSNLQNPEALEQAGAFPMVLFGIVYIAIIVIFMFILAYSITRYRSYIYENTSLDGKISLASTLSAIPLSWVMISNLLAVILTLGLALPWAKVRMARLILVNTHVNTEAGFDQYLTQKQKEESSLGEQIGDAFDVDVGLAL